MELINTSNDLFNPISELLFLDHPGFYHTVILADSGVTANPEIFCHLGQRPVTTQLHRYIATLRASFCPLYPLKSPSPLPFSALPCVPIFPILSIGWPLREES
jgi:hypothetical protein